MSKRSATVNRRVVTAGDSVLRIDQRSRIPRLEIGTDVSGPACIYAHVEVRKGTVSYLHGDTGIPAPRCFAIFLPPFAIVQARLERCDVTTTAFAFPPSRFPALPQRPLLLLAAANRAPASLLEVFGRLQQSVEGAADVARAIDPPPLASSAKRILDREYRASLAIGSIANRLQTSPATLSRTFKHAYGVSPVRYRHQLRIMDALMRFAEGAVPAQVFLDVGFDDLSRFYKIFRKVACASPGSYRPARSRNAKT